jgi:hypothetical protein
LTSNSIIRTVVQVSLIFVLVTIFVGPNTAVAQGLPSWWGSPAWFDWSDYRAVGGGKLLLANLSSGTVTKVTAAGTTTEYSLIGGPFGITNTFEPIAEFWVKLYIDRLGIRGNIEFHSFVGRSEVNPADQRLTKLDIDFSRIGVDLDVIRYPFLKLGTSTDYYFNPVKFTDRSDTVNTTDNPLYQSKEPWTLGVYGQVIPVRLRDVPVIAHAKFRFPMPFMSSNMPRITDWEIGAGIRPSIWDTSMFAHSTFSVAIEAGYRSINLDMNAIAVDSLGLLPDLQLKARWQGAFFQVEAFF